MDLIFTTTALLGVLLLIYLYIKWTFSYWARKNLDFIEPNLSRDVSEQVFESYRKSRKTGQHHGGCFAYLKPIYVPADLNIIKHIMQIDFNNFMNRDTYINEEADPVRAHLFNLQDDKWRNMRTKLTPTFTSGKMKLMFNTLADTASGLADVLKKHSSTNSPVDIKSVITRYNMDNIISVGFGVNCNTLQDPQSEFVKLGDIIFKQLGFRQKMLFLLPKYLMRLLKIRLIDPEAEKFIIDFVKQVVEYRENNNVSKKDFMHLLLQLKNLNSVTDTETILNGDNKTGNFLSINQIAAQCYVFFAAGYETSTSTTVCALYELAENQTVQDNLRQEIKTVLEKYNGEINYQAIMEMELLDKVVNETLRKHPPVTFITRVCKSKYKIPNTDVVLDAGTTVTIPFKAIHEDPEYYPNPEKFDPDRFSSKGKNSRPSFAFLPFGEGPRNCIGARFGQLQTKVGLVVILNKFKIALNEKTEMPIKKSKNFIASVTNGVWLNLEEVV